MTVTSSQFRAARAVLLWTVRDLAEKAGVHRNTIVRIEAGEASHGPTLAAVRRALEDGGIEFLPATDQGGPGVRLKLGIPEPRREPGEGEGAGGGGDGIKALSGAEDMARYYSQHPEEWCAFSRTGRQALSIEMFGDAYLADDLFGARDD